jgi:hypothetical protein
MQIDFSDIGQILIDMQIEEFEDYLNTLESS